MPKGQRQLTAGDKNPRFARFEALYVTSGNARQSALTAGFSKSYADAFAYKLALRVRTKLVPALRAAGLDEVQLAHLLKQKALHARTVKWNPKKLVAAADLAKGIKEPILGGWDEFEDHSTQLTAAELAMKAMDAFPRGKEMQGRGAGAVGIKIVFNVPRPVRPAITLKRPNAG